MSPWALRLLSERDFDQALRLYDQLFEDNPVGDVAHFSNVLAHPGTSITGAFDALNLVGMATLHVLPNMTYAGRPYALIENVVTDERVRGQGVATSVMQAAVSNAWNAGAYKIMLLTGRARGAQGFYENLGFVADEKHGMILRKEDPRLPTP